MALIIYPLDNYDAFVSIADCDAILTANVIGSQRTLYDALNDTDKEIYIRQATLLIKQRITLPDTLEDDLKTATAYLVNFSIDVDMTNEDGKQNVKSKRIEGVIDTEFFSPSESSNAFPDIVQSLIAQYETTGGSGTFSFSRA